MIAYERDYQATILDAAKLTGWRTAHFRPARTKQGWRTAVGGDGAGFPDLVLVHPGAGFVWFVELKRDDNKALRPDQDEWRLDLTRAGAVHKVVFVPSRLNAFVGELAGAHEAARHRARYAR